MVRNSAYSDESKTSTDNEPPAHSLYMSHTTKVRALENTASLTKENLARCQLILEEGRHFRREAQSMLMINRVPKILDSGRGVKIVYSGRVDYYGKNPAGDFCRNWEIVKMSFLQDLER